MSDTDFDRRLQELFENFRRQLPERLRTILASWNLYLESGQTDALEELRFHTHKLAGAASTYGYTEIGEIARQIETRLDDFIGKGEHDEIKRELQPHIDHIEELIKAAN